MKKTKRFLVFLLAACMIMSITACSNNNEATTSPESTDIMQKENSESTETTQAAIDTSEHVVVNYMVTGNVPTDKTMTDTLPILNELLTEKVNAELSVRWIEWTDYMSNYNLAIASQDGDLDLIGTATDWLDAWPNAQKGGFMELTEEMLSTYAPQTYAQVPAKNWDMCKLDGKIYLIPEDNFSQWTNHGFMYRGDWAAEAGLADGVNSWEDLGVYFQYIKDNKADVIPWDAKPDLSIVTQITSGWLTSHSMNINIEGLGSELYFGESTDNKTKLSNYFLEGDDFVNYALNQREWRLAGYWREDVLNNTSIDTTEEMEEGISGAAQHHSMTFYGTERVRMDELQPGSELGFFWFGEEMQNVISLNITHGAIAIAATSENPERALMVYDLIRNDQETYRLVNYGVENVQYVLADDGLTFSRPDGFVNDTDNSSFNYWWGRNDDLELLSPNTAVEQRQELWAEYDQCAVPYQYGQVVFNIDSISSQLDNITNLYNTYMPQIAFGTQEDPAAYIAEFREQLKAAGYKDVIAEIESQLNAVYGS